MATVTMAASTALGIYCKVLVGDAKFRSDMVGMVTDCILRWMSCHRGRCFLFGKRAWNSHLSDRTLEDSTTDVDMILYDPDTFPSMTLDLLQVVNDECGPALLYMHSFTKTHADKRGKTFTVEICGVPVADLSMRMTRGDFRLTPAPVPATPPPPPPPPPPTTPTPVTPTPPASPPQTSTAACSGPLQGPDHFSVLRKVHLTTGESIDVSVLRVSVMQSMLEAEMSSYHWRREKAEKELRKYMMFSALGFILPAEEVRVDDSSSSSSSSSSSAAEPAPAPPAPPVPPPDDSILHESSFQLPVLAQYIRQCGTLDECRRIATTLFYWREGDSMHQCILEVCEAKTIDECRVIAKRIVESAPQQ